MLLAVKGGRLTQAAANDPSPCCMVQVRILGLFLFALLSCAILSGHPPDSGSSELDSIAKALQRPGTRLQLRSNSQAPVSAHIITVPSSDGQNPLTLVWIVFPQNSVTVRASSVNKIGPANRLYDAYSPKDALVLLNGGYYGYDASHKARPLGLLVSNGNRMSDFATKWTSGGIILVRPELDIQIIPINKWNELSTPKEAIQSKPLLIENEALSVTRHPKDQPFNRSSIGLTTKGDLLVAGAFRDDNQALTLYDFGGFLELLGRLKGVHVRTALNLDGATDAHLHVISPAKDWGYEGSNYVPDVLAVVSR